MIKVDLMSGGQCSLCKRDFVIFQPYSGRYLCQSHLGQDISARARRTIRKNGWIRKGDHIGVFFQQDAESVTLLGLMAGICRNRRDVRLSVVVLRKADRDNGFHEYATRTARESCLGIITAGHGLASGTHKGADRKYLEDLSDVHGLTKIAIPATLDDTGPGVFDAVFGLDGTVSSGYPLTRPNDRIITPLMSVNLVETRYYGYCLAGTRAAPESKNAPAAGTNGLAGFQERHPSTYHALLRLWEKGWDCIPVDRNQSNYFKQ